MKDLKFIGVGGSVALEFGGNSAYLKDGKTLLLIDCCEGAAIKLKERHVFNGVENMVIGITHTHADHVAGLGVLIWYSNFILNIKPKIISNSKSFELHLKELLKLQGVKDKYFEFVDAKDVVINNCRIEMMPTTHTPALECFGIMFTDNKGKYYYTGDTNDFEHVKSLVNDSQIKKIYCEISWKSKKTHIEYEQLKTVKSDKLVLMHFEDVKLYNQAIKDQFNVANMEKN